MPPDRALPDDALVVRGGVMRPAGLVEAALDATSESGVAAISGFAADSASVSLEELLDDSLVPHDSIRISSVGRIRAAGFVIRRAGRYPHCSVELDSINSIN